MLLVFGILSSRLFAITSFVCWLSYSVSVQLISPSLETKSLHILATIPDLADFEQSVNLDSFQQSVVTSFNEINTNSQFHQFNAIDSTILKIDSLKREGSSTGGDNYDLMLLVTDSEGSYIDDTALTEAFNANFDRLTNSPLIKVLGVSNKEFVDSSTQEEEEDNKLWKYLALGAIVAFVIVFVICCVQCCRNNLCGEKRNVMPTWTLDNANLMIDLQRGEVTERVSPRNSNLRGKTSFLSTASNKPLFDDEIYTADNFKFYPSLQNGQVFLAATQDGSFGNDIELHAFPSNSIYDQNCGAFPVDTTNINQQILLSCANLKEDKQRTGTFPRCRNLTYYEKGMVHEAAIIPYEDRKKRKPVMRKASSLQDLARAVDEEDPYQINKGFVEDGKTNQEGGPLGKEAEIERSLPSFEDSLAALQKLEGRIYLDTRTLPGRLRINVKNMEQSGAKEETKKENTKEPPSFFSRLFGD